jgi:hypothetical protein
MSDMEQIILPETIGCVLGSKKALIECTRTGVDLWAVWDEDYDTFEFAGSDEEIRDLVIKRREMGYDLITDTYADKDKYLIYRVKQIAERRLAGTIDRIEFEKSIKAVYDAMFNKCSCWKCQGLEKDPYAEEDEPK